MVRYTDQTGRIVQDTYDLGDLLNGVQITQLDVLPEGYAEALDKGLRKIAKKGARRSRKVSDWYRVIDNHVHMACYSMHADVTHGSKGVFVPIEEFALSSVRLLLPCRKCYAKTRAAFRVKKRARHTRPLAKTTYLVIHGAYARCRSWSEVVKELPKEGGKMPLIIRGGSTVRPKKVLTPTYVNPEDEDELRD